MLEQAYQLYDEVLEYAGYIYDCEGKLYIRYNEALHVNGIETVNFIEIKGECYIPLHIFLMHCIDFEEHELAKYIIAIVLGE